MHESSMKVAALLDRYAELFLYSVDPGAYAIMRPLYELLSSSGKKIGWVVDGWCRKAIENQYPFLEWSSFRGSFRPMSRNDCCMVLGSQTDFEATHQAILFSQENSMASLFLFDHWTNYREHFYSAEDDRLYLPDMIGVPDQMARQALIEVLCPLMDDEKYVANIHVIGHPAIEASVNVICSLPPSECQRIKRKLTSVEKRLVLFLLEPIEDDFGYSSDGIPSIGYNEYSILSYVFSMPDFEDALIIIKPHPRQDVKKMKAFLMAYRHRDVLLSVDEKLENLIAIADEVIGMTTVALVIALKAGKRVRSIQVGRNERGENLSNAYFEENIVL